MGLSETEKKRLEKKKKELEKLNAKHPPTFDADMRLAGAATSYATNRADTVKPKHEHERAELMRIIRRLEDKERGHQEEGGRRTRRRRRTRSTRSTRSLTSRRR